MSRRFFTKGEKGTRVPIKIFSGLMEPISHAFSMDEKRKPARQQTMDDSAKRRKPPRARRRIRQRRSFCPKGEAPTGRRRVNPAWHHSGCVPLIIASRLRKSRSLLLRASRAVRQHPNRHSKNRKLPIGYATLCNDNRLLGLLFLGTNVRKRKQSFPKKMPALLYQSSDVRASG